MKIYGIYITIFLLMTMHVAHGQIQEVQWSDAIGGDLYEQSNRISSDPQGNVFLVGYFQDSLLGNSSGGFEDGFIVKYNELGQRQWIQSFGSTDVDRMSSIAISATGSIYVCGEFKGQLNSPSDTITAIDQLDAYVAKFDANGQCVWLKRIGGFDFDSANDLVVTPTGHIYVGGYFEQDLSIGSLTIPSNGLRDGFIVKLDTNGQEIWMDHIGGSGFDEIVSLSLANSDSIVVAGNFRDAINYQGTVYLGWGNYDMFVAKFSASGQMNHLSVFGGFGADYLKDVVVDPNGKMYATGWFSNELFVQGNTIFGNMEEDGFLMAFKNNGSFDWLYSLAGDFDERGIALSISPNSNIYLTGTVDSLLVIEGDTLVNRHFNRPTNVMVASFSSSGQYQWSTSFGSPFIDFPTDVHLIEDRLVVTGGFYDFFNYDQDSLFAVGQYDIFTYSFKIDTLLSIKRMDPSDRIYSLYPNPFNDHLYVTKHTNTRFVKCIISDLNGRILKSFVLPDDQSSSKISIPNGLTPEHFYIVTLFGEDKRTYSQILRYEAN